MHMLSHKNVIDLQEIYKNAYLTFSEKTYTFYSIKVHLKTYKNMYVKIGTIHIDTKMICAS